MNYVALAKLGLAGIIVVFAYLTFQLLNTHVSAIGTDFQCIEAKQKSITSNIEIAQDQTDKLVSNLFGTIQGAVDNSGDMPRRAELLRQAKLKEPDLLKNLSTERAEIPNIINELKMCEKKVDWSPFYAYIALQIILAILLFSSEIIKSKKQK